MSGYHEPGVSLECVSSFFNRHVVICIFMCILCVNIETSNNIIISNLLWRIQFVSYIFVKLIDLYIWYMTYSLSAKFNDGHFVFVSPDLQL